MFRSTRLERLARLAACWSLLLQIIIPLLHVPAGEAYAADAPAWAQAAFCHGEFAPRSASDDGSSDKSKPGKSVPVCQICLGLRLAGTFVAPGFPPLLVPKGEGFRLAIDYRANPLPAVALLAALPRGPPISA
jgi:hypothetical protein